MINNVVLVGRLTREIELRQTQTGVPVANFTLACDRNFKNNDGSTSTDFINCVIWRKKAEVLAQYTRKGTLIGIVGSIQTRNYENNQGQRVYITEVSVQDFTFLEPKSVTEQRPRQENSYSNYNSNFNSNFNNQNPFEISYNNDNPFMSNHNQGSSPFDNQSRFSEQNPFQGSNDDGGSINISDDDLPF